jgi:uncharacterized protein YjdB
MKAKKLFLPFVMLGLTAAFGLAACSGNPDSKPSKGGEASEPASEPEGSQPEEEEIVITAAGDAKEVQVGGTLQLTASVEGVTWESRAEDIAKVDDKGLVTAIKAGTVRIRAKKDGYKTGSFSLTVTKAPEKPAKATLHMEDADHFSPNDKWGMNYGGQWYGPNADGDSPVEEGGGSDGTHIGWLQAGCKETLTFTSNKAIKVELGVTMAYNAETALEGALSVKFNNTAISMSGLSCPGPEDGDTNNYYDFQVVSFGMVDLVNGNNVLEIEMVAQGVNLDDVRIYTDEDVTITVVKPVVMERIQVETASFQIEVAGTAQITTATAGVSYASEDATIASVSASGLITGVAAGRTTITVSKDGMKPATVSVQVKAPFVPTAYALEAGKAVRLELENGEFYCQQGSWGYAQWGITPNHDGGETPIEDQESASGGMSLGYFNQTSKVTMKFTSPKAGTVAIKLCAASANEFALDGQLEIKVNDTAVTLTDKVVEGGGNNNYYDWKVIDLGSAAVKSGDNTLTIEVLASQGCNLDYVELTLA